MNEEQQELIRLTIKDPTTLGCPLCLFTVDVPEVPVVDELGAVFGITGKTLAMLHGEQLVGSAVRELRSHMAGHGVMEWLRAVTA